ncbi:MAG: hypothetical protein HYU86_09280 [Chloroflexi bacterium]|nr:hypothetical protein [Chloroflexota bacterium]
MRILHILRNLDEKPVLSRAEGPVLSRAEGPVLTIIREHLKQGHQVTLLLLHDAVLGNFPVETSTFACLEDVRARGGKTNHPTLDYDDILRLIFDNERTISW